MFITPDTIQKALRIKLKQKFKCTTLGLVNSPHKSTLTFLDDKKYLKELIENENIKVVFTLDSFASALQNAGKMIIVCDDARYDFYSLQNYLAKKTYIKKPSVINPTAFIHPKAYVCEHNVVIGAHTVIEANATILSDVEIGERCIIRAGAILGCEGFEHKRTTKGILSVIHDGKVILKNDVEIGAGTCVSKGFSYRHTLIDDFSKTDNLVHIAHCVQIGKRCLFPACAMIAGSVTIGDDVWIGPGASITSGVSIGNKVFITIGSVVTKSVKEGAHLTGNFAIDHNKFLEHIKKIR